MKRRKLRLTNNRIPVLAEHIIAMYRSGRRFRQTKRADVERALRAVRSLHVGCAYIPRGEELVEPILKALRELKAAVSQREWGR